MLELITGNLGETLIALLIAIGGIFTFLKRRDARVRKDTLEGEKQKDKDRAESIRDRVDDDLADVVRKHDDAGFRD